MKQEYEDLNRYINNKLKIGEICILENEEFKENLNKATKKQPA